MNNQERGITLCPVCGRPLNEGLHDHENTDGLTRQSGRIERREQLPRNLLTHFEETLTAIQVVEAFGGGGTMREWWEREQRTKKDSVYTAIGILEGLKKGVGGGVIYGVGGFNRWPVSFKGTVSFSRVHAINQEAIKRALELGFEIC